MVKRKYDELLEKLNECTSKDIASALGALDEDKLKDVITNPTLLDKVANPEILQNMRYKSGKRLQRAVSSLNWDKGSKKFEPTVDSLKPKYDFARITGSLKAAFEYILTRRRWDLESVGGEEEFWTTTQQVLNLHSNRNVRFLRRTRFMSKMEALMLFAHKSEWDQRHIEGEEYELPEEIEVDEDEDGYIDEIVDFAGWEQAEERYQARAERQKRKQKEQKRLQEADARVEKFNLEMNGAHVGMRKRRVSNYELQAWESDEFQHSLVAMREVARDLRASPHVKEALKVMARIDVAADNDKIYGVALDQSRERSGVVQEDTEMENANGSQPKSTINLKPSKTTMTYSKPVISNKTGADSASENNLTKRVMTDSSAVVTGKEPSKHPANVEMGDALATAEKPATGATSDNTEMTASATFNTGKEPSKHPADIEMRDAPAIAEEPVTRATTDNTEMTASAIVISAEEPAANQRDVNMVDDNKSSSEAAIESTSVEVKMTGQDSVIYAKRSEDNAPESKDSETVNTPDTAAEQLSRTSNLDAAPTKPAMAFRLANGDPNEGQDLTSGAEIPDGLPPSNIPDAVHYEKTDPQSVISTEDQTIDKQQSFASISEIAAISPMDCVVQDTANAPSSLLPDVTNKETSGPLLLETKNDSPIPPLYDEDIMKVIEIHTYSTTTQDSKVADAIFVGENWGLFCAETLQFKIGTAVSLFKMITDASVSSKASNQEERLTQIVKQMKKSKAEKMWGPIREAVGQYDLYCELEKAGKDTVLGKAGSGKDRAKGNYYLQLCKLEAAESGEEWDDLHTKIQEKRKLAWQNHKAIGNKYAYFVEGRQGFGEGILLLMPSINDVLKTKTGDESAIFSRWNKGRILAMLEKVSQSTFGRDLRGLCQVVGSFLRDLLHGRTTPDACLEQLADWRKKMKLNHGSPMALLAPQASQVPEEMRSPMDLLILEFPVPASVGNSENNIEMSDYDLRKFMYPANIYDRAQQEAAWLNDKCVRGVLLCAGFPSNVFVLDSLLLRLNGPKLPRLGAEIDTVICPANTLKHWILYVIKVTRSNKKISFVANCYDSSGNGSRAIDTVLPTILRIMFQIKKLDNEDIKIQSAYAASQQNCFDCGVAVIANAIALIKGFTPPDTLNPNWSKSARLQYAKMCVESAKALKK